MSNRKNALMIAGIVVILLLTFGLPVFVPKNPGGTVPSAQRNLVDRAKGAIGDVQKTVEEPSAKAPAAQARVAASAVMPALEERGSDPKFAAMDKGIPKLSPSISTANGIFAEAVLFWPDYCGNHFPNLGPRTSKVSNVFLAKVALGGEPTRSYCLPGPVSDANIWCSTGSVGCGTVFTR